MSRRPRSSAPVSDTLALPGGTLSRFSVLPLRLFLGVTFMYAAVQKLTDPGFFRAGSPTYIGAQILAFSRGSPIGSLLHHLMQFAVIVGALTIATEGAIGILILIGLLTRPAAIIGMVLSTGFFLSASWTTYPYFFGSDIVFVVCWLTLALTGPGAFALDLLLQERMMRSLTPRFPGRVSAVGLRLLTGFRPTGTATDAVVGVGAVADGEARHAVMSRGEALLGSIIALGFIALGLHPRPSSNATGGTTLAGGSPAPPSGSTPAPKANSGAAIPAGAKKIGNVSQLPVNTAGTVSDPKTGDPAVIVHTADSKFVAFDAVCTHAGCTVQYDPQQKLLACPCHGGMFDPAHGAQVVAGPPPSPLTPIQLAIDAHGDIYIV